MDPTECLTRIRELVAQAREVESLALHPEMGDSDGGLPSGVAALVEHVEALDGWLSRGGFLPDQWPTPAGLVAPPF